MALRDLPSVDALAARLGTAGIPGTVAVEAARTVIADARQRILAGEDLDFDTVAAVTAKRLQRIGQHPVINATGVLLHTNLGRAIVHPDAAAAAASALSSYTTVEFDLTTGQRGGRGVATTELLRSLTGAEDALVVNNNAAALLLALAAVGGEGGVVVSRGELIEIGGSFRLPEIMAASGKPMLEVGTTNRTRLADYATAATTAGALLKVHPSNYRVTGFAEEASYRQLGSLAGGLEIPFIADVGSGLLDTRTPWLGGPPPAWLAGEPGVRQTLEAGADVVLFSGDKLLGGPQSGIAVGSAKWISEMRRHPIARTVRCGSAALASLTSTLELYADGRGDEIPFWAMATIPYDTLAGRCRQIIESAGVQATIDVGGSLPGAGSVPGETIPSPVVRVEGDADELWNHLLDQPKPIIARREADTLLIDLRAVVPADDYAIAAALAR